MPEPSPRFKKLAEAFKASKHPGWWIPSAEGGWTTPSEEEWGHRPRPIPFKGVEQSQDK
jgi:hypothetical protein